MPSDAQEGPKPTPIWTMRDLAWLSDERMIGDDTAWWPRIAVWQKRGWVRLRWKESRLFCFVQLTDKGREHVGIR